MTRGSEDEEGVGGGRVRRGTRERSQGRAQGGREGRAGDKGQSKAEKEPQCPELSGEEAICSTSFTLEETLSMAEGGSPTEEQFPR